MACDQPTQDLPTRADEDRIINLEGKEEDEDRAVLVNSIIHVIAEDTEFDLTGREVEIV